LKHGNDGQAGRLLLMTRGLRVVLTAQGFRQKALNRC